jgi:hypothetical protein
MGAKLPDLETYWQAGIDPRTGLPLKFSNRRCLKDDIKKQLRIKDEQTAINRYKWENLPATITSEYLERMLYYKGQLCFFYDKDLEEFYFMPYALDGTIDFYGRFNTIHPIPMTSGTDDKGNKAQAQYLAQKKLKCIYDETQIKENDPNTLTILLKDYSEQLSQTIIPRVSLQDSLLDVMSDCIPFMRTALLLSTGIEGIRVNDADQQDDITAANRSMENAALVGDPYVPIVGSVEFQELNNGSVGKSEEFMLAMQSLENFRLSTYGIDSSGVYEKKAHTLESEQDMNKSPAELISNDGLALRQKFCDLAKAIWGLDIKVSAVKVEASEGAEDTIDEEETSSEDNGGKDNE